MDIKTKEFKGETYYSTLSIYKYIELSTHQKLKEKVQRLGLDWSEVPDLGAAIPRATVIRVLEAYRLTLKNGQLVKLNQLLDHLGKLGKPNYNSVNESIPKLEDAYTVGKPAYSAGKPMGVPVYPEKTDLPTSNQNNESGLPSVDPLSEIKVSEGKMGNSTEPDLTELASTKNTFSVGVKKTGEPIVRLLMDFLARLPMYLRSEYFVFLVLIFAIGIQVNHTAVFFHRLALKSDPTAGQFGAYLFGGVTELTALLLTVHKGKRDTLKTFGFLTFWLNLLYYRVWEDFGLTIDYGTTLIAQITASGVIAFIVFTYSQLFTMDIFKEDKESCETDIC
jgi:hypothetical protein